MLVKSVLLNRIMLVCLVSIVAFVNAIPGDWSTKAIYAADAPATGDAQAAVTDRISFYNVPSDHKLELHLDYANGRTEKIKYPSSLCAPGTAITYDLNLYAVKFVAEGCETTVFQNLNLRWMGDCRFEFEHDPDARIIARGPYGEVVIVEGHYPAGALQLTNLPANTTSLYATMIYTNEQGIVQTGNVEFTFHAPQLGCGQAPLATPTSTATLTATVETATPTNTATPTATIETPTVTPTATPAVLSPTNLDSVDEPKAPTLILYLPLVVK